MSCYLRHLKEIFPLIGIEENSENRKFVDRGIKEFLNLPMETRCPEVWLTIKQKKDEAEFINQLVAYLTNLKK